MPLNVYLSMVCHSVPRPALCVLSLSPSWLHAIFLAFPVSCVKSLPVSIYTMVFFHAEFTAREGDAALLRCCTVFALLAVCGPYVSPAAEQIPVSLNMIAFTGRGVFPIDTSYKHVHRSCFPNFSSRFRCWDISAWCGVLRYYVQGVCFLTFFLISRYYL